MSDTAQAKYKWDNPSDWLRFHLNTLEGERKFDELTKIAWLLVTELDDDAIQDLFQDEMDEDGYFDEEVVE